MSKLDNPWRAVMFVGAIGVDLAVCVLLGFWGGKALDETYSTAPIFLLVGIIVGLAVGIYAIVLMIKPFLGE